MQITHKEARKLMQFNLDGTLHIQEKGMLSEHLQNCIECQAYDKGLKEMEKILLHVTKKHWNLKPIPLSINSLNPKNTAMHKSIILATRTAMISFVFVAFLFGIWQFMLSSKEMPTQQPIGILPVPTPSVQSTTTRIMQQNCKTILYIIQKDDTLESIAKRFSTSKEELMAMNHLRTEIVNASMELIIPACSSTPTETANSMTLTTTYTPVIATTSSSPGG